MLLAYSCHNKDAANDAASTDPNKLSQNLVNIPASANGTTNGKLPKLVFSDTNHDFGTITAGDKVSCAFVFKNEGEGDLIITSAAASCGCTKPYYPKGVKHPGDTGTISVTFDSSNKQGKVVKTITLTSNNQPNFRYLTITANIQPSNN